MIFRSRSSFLSLLVAALLFAPLLCGNARADKLADANRTKPFEPAEELIYEGEFSKSLLRGLNIAELRLIAVRAASSNSDAARPFNFTVEAVSKGFFPKLFGLNFRERVESTVEAESFSVLKTEKLDEQGNRKRTSTSVFDQSAGKVVWTELDPNDSQRPPRVVTADFKGAVHDLASIFYYLRLQPLRTGDKFEVLVSDSGRVYRVPVRVSEQKKIKTALGRVATVRVEADIFGEGRLIAGKGSLSIWFTDDARHTPVQARVNADIGTVNIKLKSVSNTVNSGAR